MMSHTILYPRDRLPTISDKGAAKLRAPNAKPILRSALQASEPQPLHQSTLTSPP